MKPSQVKLDLLAWRPLRWLWRSPAFPVALQALAIVAVLLLVTNGLGLGPGMSAEELMTFRKTNLTTLVVWGLWWPGMIAVALAFGRAWCTVCPMELVNRIGDAAARKAGWPRARLGKLLRAGWMIVVLYLVLQLLVAGVSMHRVPHFTAILLLVLLGGALATGLVFREPRSFCRAFCPAGALLSVYGRYTPVQLEVRDLRSARAVRPRTASGARTAIASTRGAARRFSGPSIVTHPTWGRVHHPPQPRSARPVWQRVGPELPAGVQRVRG